VRQDILASLHMASPATFEVSFFRPNLHFRVIKARAWQQQRQRAAGSRTHPAAENSTQPPSARQPALHDRALPATFAALQPPQALHVVQRPSAPACQRYARLVKPSAPLPLCPLPPPPAWLQKEYSRSAETGLEAYMEEMLLYIQ
jgi:hypothetical protein